MKIYGNLWLFAASLQRHSRSVKFYVKKVANKMGPISKQLPCHCPVITLQQGTSTLNVCGWLRHSDRLGLLYSCTLFCAVGEIAVLYLIFECLT